MEREDNIAIAIGTVIWTMMACGIVFFFTRSVMWTIVGAFGAVIAVGIAYGLTIFTLKMESKKEAANAKHLKAKRSVDAGEA